MLSPQGNRTGTRRGSLKVVYVGDETERAALAEALPDGEVRHERRAASALERVEAEAVDCVVAETDLADVEGSELLAAVGQLYPDVARVLLAESVERAPSSVEFVPTRPRAGLPVRTARRVEQAVSHRETARERDRYADRFETLVERSPDPILTVDERCEVVYANEAVERTFGYEPEALVGDSALKLLDESVRDRVETAVDRLAASAGTVERDYAELPGRHREGHEVPLAISYRETVRDGRHYFSAVVRDVSQRTRLERRLETEKRRTEELHEVAVMLEECDTAEEVCRLAVEAAEQLLEFDRCAVDTVEDGELVPQAVSKGVPSDGYYTTTPLSADDNLAARAYRRGESILTEDIRETSVEPAASGYRSSLTVPVADIGVFQAVSEEADAFEESDRELAELLVSHVAQSLRRIHSEAALAAERDRFAALFENVPEPTVDYEFRDGEPIVRSVNEAFEEVFGYDAGEAVGRSLDDLIVPDDELQDAKVINEWVAAGARVDTEVRREAADGVRNFLLRTAQVPESRGNYVIYTDVTERKRREERHRSMTEDVLDNTDVGIFVLDDEFEVAWANAAVGEYFGLDREAVLGEDKRSLVEDRTAPAVADSGTFAQTVTATYDDNSDAEEFTCHVLADDDREERYLHHRSRPIESGLYAGGRVELYYDVTERVEREAMLDALHGATRELMAAERQRDICETAVETAREVMDIPHAAVFRLDEESRLLEPYVLPDDTVVEVGAPPSFEPGEGIVGGVFENGDADYFDNAWTDSRAHDDGSERIRAFGAFPLGDWGVLTVASGSVGVFDDYEMDLVRVLAANTEVALNRAARETELAERQRQLAELDRINEVIRDVDQLLVRASTREEMEQAVCDRLAGSAHYRFAWTGEAIAGSNRLEPTARAGVGEGYLEAVAAESDGTLAGPADAALETGEVRVVESVPDDEEFAPWREQALERGYRSAAAIPLRYRETVYGVLCVYADRPNAFDDRERAVLTELGETIGHAINAVESKKALLSDGVVEVELDVRDGEGFFSRVPREEGGRFTLDGVTMTAEGSFVYFMTAEGLDPDRVLARAEAADDVERARLVNEHDDGDLFEFVYTGPSPMPVLADHGGTLRDARFTSDGGRSVVELPRHVDVRGVVDSIRESVPETAVVARRERERPDRTVEEFRASLAEDLTERQRSALEAAFYAGFFEWPRESTGEEVSDSLGVAAPTFHQHLRVAERKLLAAFLDE